MSWIRFNHVFLVLLLGSAVFAFVLPPRWANGVRGKLDWLFAPVAYPVRKVAANVSGKWVDAKGNPAAGAGQGAGESQKEIEKLRAQVANLSTQVEELGKLKNIEAMAGVAGERGRAFRVIGGDVSGLDALTLESGAADLVEANMPVLHQQMLVGRIASGGGARVRLITDRGMRMDAAIYQFDAKLGALVARPTPALLVEGAGGGTMVVLNLKKKDVDSAKVQVGDWVQLKDSSWPREVQGMLIGEVEKIEGYARGPGFAQITVRPRASLPQLTEVLVVTGAEDVKETKSGTNATKQGAVKKTTGTVRR